MLGGVIGADKVWVQGAIGAKGSSRHSQEKKREGEGHESKNYGIHE